jgi:formylglycine-generating enzyme
MKYITLFLLLLTACTTKVDEAFNNYTPASSSHIQQLATIVIQSSCPADMVYIERQNHAYCIDKYEWPNIVGEYPTAAINAYEATNLCSSVGKRICEYNEWYNACVGKENFRYSYGQHHIRGYCNDEKTGWVKPRWELMGTPGWKTYAHTLYKGDIIGAHPNCKSDEGVYDMLGNVREWTRSPGTRYGYTVAASYWYGDMQTDPNLHLSCKYKIVNHSQSFSSYEFGARCCKDSN